MQRIRIKTIKPGQTFPQSLFLASGQKLLDANVSITERYLELLRRYGDQEVVLAESLDELAEAGLVQKVHTRLAVGQTSQEGVYTRTGALLLEPGQEIEEHHLDAISAGGGVYRGGGSGPAGDDERRSRLLAADDLIVSLEQELTTLPRTVAPARQQDWMHPVDPSSWPRAAELFEQRAQAVDTLRKLYARIEAGVPVASDDFNPIVDDLLDKLSQHPTRFTQLALLIRGRADYLPDHGYTVAVLAMSIATNLKWGREDVSRIGLAGLVFDLGMLLVPQRVRQGADQLSNADRERVRKHPLYSLSMLEKVDDCPPIVKLAALQHHEREDGSGYPRGRRKEMISDYARVLAVADAFAATMSPRSYRQKKLPYIAMEETLRLAAAMIFWSPACRALVQSAGLFPVGSGVKLSSGQLAHVIGSHAQMVDRPIVQPLDQQLRPVGKPIDLSQVPKEQLSVVRPVQISEGTL